ncbi:MAG TPA: aminotransferase class III-fold pyridoxal phosphate-dependent enzyme [Gaiellales bacterium]|nr:aminotransferase class III-fold pyridoxal phosphate-dependent enzyme [Gaiellales bacterium]
MAEAMTALGVLEASPPRFSPAEIAAIAADLFGVRGDARDLGSERDQTFLVEGEDGSGVLKVSNLAEDPLVLDFETAALEHIARADPELPVARQLAAPDGGYRPSVRGPDGDHYVRLFQRLSGGSIAQGDQLDDAALAAYGATTARLAAALRSFFHPGAGRRLLWDTANASELRPLADSIADPRQRALVTGALDLYEERALPAWPRLRAQVVHGDLALDNVLLDERGFVCGIVDFGDLVHTALLVDLAAALASALRGRPPADVYRSARVFLDGYQSRTPLEPLELELLPALLGARLATIVTISAWRVVRYPENAEYIQAWDAATWPLLEQLAADGPDRARRELTGTGAAVADAELAERRRRVLGSALTAPTYSRPVHLGRGEGTWLIDVDGRRLLDAYNNVPVVGHCHPRVTEAVVRQTRTLNTHARYLYEPLIELAERLVATMPEGSGLDTVLLLNSGSEANDIAWQIATTCTGVDGAVITGFAYHGITEAIADLSPEEWPAGFHPEQVALLEPAGGVGAWSGPAAAAAVERLAAAGRRPAAILLDPCFTSDGIHTPPKDDVRAMVEAVRRAGGLVVADEVQAGHGRTGEHLWSFESYDLRPDMVSLGKPMGNGYPVAALIARAELVDRFAARADFFSTFGGNPVAAVAALTVLDVIADERLVERAGRVGASLGAALKDVAGRHPAVAAVRRRGLLAGVEIATEAGGAGRASAVLDGMRERGVLVGLTGPQGNVIKIRPPLVFGEQHVPILAQALDEALAAPFSARA